MADSVKVQHIPFYFENEDDFISYISGTNNAGPNIVLGGGIQNLITFYQMAKEGLIKDSLVDGFDGKTNITKGTNVVTEYVGGNQNANLIFSPYKVTLGATEVKKDSFKTDEYAKIGFVEVKKINDLVMGGNNTTRKGGRRRRKARGRKTPKRRVKKSKK